MTESVFGRGSRVWRARICFAAMFAAAGWFYFWSARAENVSWNFGQKQTDYYNLLAEGFLAGHLYMETDVPEALAQLADPYNPQNRPPGLGLHDASFYRGKYYLYFGAAPVVTLLVPFRLLTGIALPLQAAVVIFTFGGFLASALTWLQIRRRYFPDAGLGLSLMCLFAVATVSMGPVLARRANIWELPLSGGYCFAMIALGCVFQSLHAVRRHAWWFAGAGLSLGLAVASRPTYLYAVGLLVVPLAWWWAQRRPAASRRGLAPPLRQALAGLLPLAAVGAAMAIYNYERFGDPLEFGVAYQFSGIYEAQARHFSFSYLPFNLGLYFFRPAAWSGYFPFIHQIATPLLPAGYFGFEEVYGVLVNLPLVWLALLAPLAARNRRPDERGPLLAWLGATAVLAAGTILALGLFYASMARYEADFMPALTLLATLGVLAMERAVAGWKNLKRRLVLGACWGLLVFSIFVAVLFNFNLYGNLRRDSPRTYAQIARVCDYPSQWLETLRGTAHGPVEMELKFAPHTSERREPLLSTGWFGAADHVFVQYRDDGRMSVGYAHDGGHEELSRPVVIDRQAAHHLRIEMGSLYPPEEHPFFARLSGPEVDRLSRQLLVELDGQVLLESYARFNAASPGTLRIGRDELAAAYGQNFSGEIRHVRRDTDFATLTQETETRCRLRVRPEPEAQFEKQPLLTAIGAAGPEVWWMSALPETRMKFGCGSPATGAWESEAIPGDAATTHEIEVVSFHRAPGRASEGSSRVEVKLDGLVVWSPPPVVAFDRFNDLPGRNETAFAACAPVFRGSIQREDAADTPAYFDTVRLSLVFRSSRAQKEPLVVTGESGRGDFLFVEYLDGVRLRFGLEHWGKPPMVSEPLVLDRAVPHLVEVSLGCFPVGIGVVAALAQRVHLNLDGRTVWDAPARFYPVEAADVFIGRNPIGGSACEPVFTGELLKVERVTALDRTGK